MKKRNSSGIKIIVGTLCLTGIVWAGSHYVKLHNRDNHNEIKQEKAVTYNKWGIDYLLHQLKDGIRKDPRGKNSYLDSILNFTLEVKEENNLAYQSNTVDRLFDIVERELRNSNDVGYMEKVWLQFPEEKKEKVVKRYFESLPYQRKWDILKPVLAHKLKEGGKQVIDDFKEILSDVRDYDNRKISVQSKASNKNMKENLQVLKKYLLGDN